jgi:hypothetical protein
MEVHGIVGELLAKRGFSGEALEAFLDSSLKRLADASRLPGLSEAADCIIPFVREKRKIVVFGDYDCDGVCASAILALTFRRFIIVRSSTIRSRLITYPPLGSISWRFTPFIYIGCPFTRSRSPLISTCRNPTRCTIVSTLARLNAG